MHVPAYFGQWQYQETWKIQRNIWEVSDVCPNQYKIRDTEEYASYLKEPVNHID